MLEKHYRNTLFPFATDEAYVKSCWHELETLYTQPQRHYHNLYHLTSMIDVLKEFSRLEQVSPAFLLALFYHDAIYDATKSDNELQSIKLMEQHLTSTTFDQIDTCKKLITATINHNPTDNCDINLFLDLDISILGQRWDQYREYMHAIRKEYGHMSSASYTTGRVSVLKKFLARERLFITDEFYTRYERTARENISREIIILDKKKW